MPEGLVEEIMQRRDESGTIVLTPGRPVVGDAVKVTVGRFADVEALFQTMSGRDRVIVLINLLGREVRASAPLTGLAA